MIDLLKVMSKDEDTGEQEENYYHPNNSTWVIAINDSAVGVVIRFPNIHWSFLENGNLLEDLCISGYEGLPAGLYKVKCSFCTSTDCESGLVDEYDFSIIDTECLYSLDAPEEILRMNPVIEKDPDKERALQTGALIIKACKEYAEIQAGPLQDRIHELETYVSRLMHTYCECGDEFTNNAEDHYMIIENGECVNCRCASGEPLKIKDVFLDDLYESRKPRPTAVKEQS